MTSLKILITGAYSTGKSTLIAVVSKSLESSGIPVFVLSDSSREINFPLNREQGHDTTLWLLSWQISKERLSKSLGASYRVVFCDRGVPDILAHDLEARRRGQELQSEIALQAALNWCCSYDLSFLSTIDETIPVQEDGVRVADPSYRRLMGEFAAQTAAYLTTCQTLPLALEDRVTFVRSRILSALGYSEGA
ncbi:AAA family ATPase [Roseinatronobacter bogoriensis]|uniref:AAA family ATPase n=1 Tax=Roseinatronobacter bogoriensis TaxID=119542 RepID=UPI0010D487B1|nr:putative ATPase [Rhodobaca bogoriensis DSM 18756]TDW33706.1 AAA domain-containing protein [Rhodobaca barguzinensis]TDY66176.1 AAA domain-containing protein [Rhodobaca bogoriensis DSM 18756]